MKGAPDLLATGTLTWETAVRIPRLPGDGRVDMAGVAPLLEGAIARVDGGGGSAANVAVAAARSGLAATFVGQVGDDEEGRRCVEALRRAGVDARVARLPGRRTKRSVLLVEASTGRVEFRVDVPAGAVPPLPASAVSDDLLRGARWLHLDRVSEAAVDLLGRRGDRPSSLDLHDIPRRAGTIARLRRVLGRLALLQVREAALESLFEGTGGPVIAGEAAPLPGPDDAGQSASSGLPCRLEDGLRRLSATIPRIVVTRGESGAVAIEAGGPPWAVPPEPVPEAIDPSGAGDAFAAALLAGLLAGEPFAACCRRAAVAGAEACSWLGARRPFP